MQHSRQQQQAPVCASVCIEKSQPAFYSRGFAQAQHRLLRRIRTVLQHASEQTKHVLHRALSDLDWSHPDAAAHLLGVINTHLNSLQRAVPNTLEPVLDAVAQDAYRCCRIAQVSHLTRRYRARATKHLAVFGTPDERALKQMQRVRRVVIRQGWQERLEDFSDRARGLLTQAARDGLSKRAVGRQMQAAFGRHLGLSPGQASKQEYWELTGSAWLNTARNRANLQTYCDAGITQYRILAVVDERTTPVCQSLDGTVFSVQAQLQHEEQAAASNSLDELKARSPWLSAKQGPQAQGAATTQVGIRSSRGFVPLAHTGGKAGGTKLLHSPQQLQRLGVGMPPYHAHCRTTVVAV